MAFLPLLLLGTIWTCKAFGPEKYLSQWPQEAAELENHSWEEGSQFTHAQYHDDFNYASQFSNPHHASSTTTPYPFNSYDQVDSSSWEIPGNLGFNQYGHNTPADHWYLTQADASSWANLPSDSYPIATEAHGAPEHETSAPTVWQKLLASANGHDWQSHLDPVSNVPESNHDPTGSMILEAPAHYSSNSLELHTPASASSLGPATSFGLPIEWFTKDFLQEVAQPTEASELNQDTAPGATKGATEGANIGSYYKLESHMRSFEGGLAVVLRDDEDTQQHGAQFGSMGVYFCMGKRVSPTDSPQRNDSGSIQNVE
ncbi:hypothetical protein PCANC_21186 [Puccinia coronata f. sp. avenae]|uniref:Uncharacterized protein n=1 Tax=Puccinia coronata f. sp. avenae TaxID=200324 RepID=A0A2N5TY77_9BASI|nr:hypothetical protein PCANC_21186 [Puccinia coronata f. sp. avenae]